MPSHLKRYQQEGSYHFITFSCYQRLPYLNDDHSRIIFEEILEQLRQRHGFFVFGYVLMAGGPPTKHSVWRVAHPQNLLGAPSIRAFADGWGRGCQQLLPAKLRILMHRDKAGGPPTKPFWVPHPYALLRMGGVEGASSYHKTCRAT